MPIPYEFMDEERSYEPDFIVRLVNELHLLLEIKGYEVQNADLNTAKYGAARRWIEAVNNLREFGRWGFEVCKDLDELDGALKRHAGR